MKKSIVLLLSVFTMFGCSTTNMEQTETSEIKEPFLFNIENTDICYKYEKNIISEELEKHFVYKIPCYRLIGNVGSDTKEGDIMIEGIKLFKVFTDETVAVDRVENEETHKIEINTTRTIKQYNDVQEIGLYYNTNTKSCYLADNVSDIDKKPVNCEDY